MLLRVDNWAHEVQLREEQINFLKNTEGFFSLSIVPVSALWCYQTLAMLVILKNHIFGKVISLSLNEKEYSFLKNLLQRNR